MVRKKVVDDKVAGFKFRYVFYTIFVTLLLLALFSHHPEDIGVLEGGSTHDIQNWIGPVGANISRILLYFFGLASYPLVIVFVICGIRPYLSFPVNRRGYIGALIAVTLGATILFAMFPESLCSITDRLQIGHLNAPKSALSGGVIGQLLASPQCGDIKAGLIRRFIGTVGTGVVASIFLLTGLFFIWLADWKLICVSLLNGKKDKGKANVSLQRDTRKSKAEKTEKVEDTPPWRTVDDGPVEIDRGEKYVEKSNEAEEPAPPRATLLVDESEDTPLKRSSELKVHTGIPGEKPVLKKIDDSGYVLPPIKMLEKITESIGESDEDIEEARIVLQKTLESFNVDGKVTGIITGPRVTRFEVSLSPGVKVQKVESIASNIAMELAAESIRILAPIPGKSAVGVEVPNSSPSAVFMRSLMETTKWKGCNADIPIILGKDVAGKPVILDLAKAPHLLIAGATGSGKSVCMNTLIMSLLFKFSPSELRLIMVDPKVVELEMYTKLPHLITPVVNDPNKVPLALRWGVNEMEKRYRIMAKVRAKNLNGFNSRPIPKEPLIDDNGNEIPDKMPYLVIIIDELADVMMTDAKSDVETSIARIAQKGRAAGIHIVIATQRPSTNIITGVIKANLPTRIAFRVGSLVDSRVILDQKGAEKLLGRGDMLFIPPGSSNLDRIQGAMVDDSDIDKVADFVASQVDQEFDEGVVKDGESEDVVVDNHIKGDNPVTAPMDPIVAKYLQPGDNENIKKSLEILFTDRKISTSYIQRRLGIGYNKAAEIMDIFEKRGIISAPAPGGSKRDILVFDEIEQGI